MSLSVRFSSPRVRRLAQRALTGTLGPRGRRRLGRQLEASQGDRQAYHHLVQLFRTLERQPSLTAAQHDAILDQALRAAGAPRPSSGGRVLRWLAPVAALLLVVAGATLLLPRDGELQRRGSRTLEPRRRGRVGLRVHCVRQGAIVEPPARETGLDARCRLHDELQLTVTHTAGHGHLLVVGLQEAGARRWYFPVPPTGRSAPAPRGGDSEPLGQAIHLEVNHEPGPLRIVALFSDAALQAERVFAWLETREPPELADRLATGRDNNVTAVELRVMIEGGAR